MEVWNDGLKTGMLEWWHIGMMGFNPMNRGPFQGDPGSFPNLPLFEYSTIPDVWRNIELP